VRFLPLAQVIANCDFVLSTVTTSAAVAAARSVAPHLTSRHTYIDFNSTAPAVKQEIAQIVAPTGAQFVEAAILSAIGVSGAKARILICDPAGPARAERLAKAGLNAVFYGTEIGRASAFKLLRSVFSKGIEALLLEFLVAGRRAGLQEELWREVTDLFAQHGFEKSATNWIQTHASAHERRYQEMRQVTEAVRALGLDPVMTAATEEFFRRSGSTGLKAELAGKAPSIDDVIAVLARDRRK
jgi:3-hydroxyisobutyrate dehydrogenase-like beta-hydroxyacid dehydrogenase